METLNLNVNLENLTAEEREMLMKLVEKSGKKSKVWKPDWEEQYYTLDPSKCNQILQYTWFNDGVDNRRYEYGEIYKTKEEAEEGLTRRKMLVKWKRLSIEAGEGENEWNGENDHWEIGYSHLTSQLETYRLTNCKYGEVYFPTKDSLLAAIKELGEDNVKRYILGVRD